MTEKIKAVKFWMTYLEAAAPGWDRPVKSWVEFDSLLNKIAHSPSNPNDGGYDKCDYNIKFEDDEIYSGRLDIHNWQHYPSGRVCLADEMFSRMAIRAGLWRPAWMDDEYYELIMRVKMPEWEEKCKIFLANYELPVQDAGFQEVLDNDRSLARYGRSLSVHYEPAEEVPA